MTANLYRLNHNKKKEQQRILIVCKRIKIKKKRKNKKSMDETRSAVTGRSDKLKPKSRKDKINA